MSLIPKQTVQIIAQGTGISHLGEDVAAALAPDAEYRMREIIQVSGSHFVASAEGTSLSPQR